MPGTARGNKRVEVRLGDTQLDGAGHDKVAVRRGIVALFSSLHRAHHACRRFSIVFGDRVGIRVGRGLVLGAIQLQRKERDASGGRDGGGASGRG